MSLISKIQSLISSANAVTGESRTDLTSAVQDLKDGYGGSSPVGKFIQIRAYEVTIGENTVSNVRELVSTLETAAATYNAGVLIGYSAVENLEYYNAIWCCGYSANNLPSMSNAMRYRNGTLSVVTNSAGYDAAVQAGTKYVIYLSKSEGLS